MDLLRILALWRGRAPWLAAGLLISLAALACGVALMAVSGAMIGTAVASLNRLEVIVPAVQDLGRRHAGYGVQPAHYDTVATALLWTLGQGLGDAFTPPVKAAWTEAYTILATVMKDAATA